MLYWVCIIKQECEDCKTKQSVVRSVCGQFATGFDFWPVRVRFVVHKVTMRQGFSPSTPVSPCQYNSPSTPVSPSQYNSSSTPVSPCQYNSTSTPVPLVLLFPPASTIPPVLLFPPASTIPPILLFPPASTIPPMLHTHLNVARRTNGRSAGIFKQSKA